MRTLAQRIPAHLLALPAIAIALVIAWRALAGDVDHKNANVTRSAQNDSVTWADSREGDDFTRTVTIAVDNKITKLNDIKFDPEAGSDWAHAGGVGDSSVTYTGTQKPDAQAKRYEPTFSGKAIEGGGGHGGGGGGGGGGDRQPYDWTVDGQYDIKVVDLDVDTNNDGTIDSDNTGEDQYEAWLTGVVVCKNRAGDGKVPDGWGGEPFDHLVPVKLSYKLTTDGTLTLSASLGAERLKIWTDSHKSAEVKLPKRYNLPADTVPATLWLDGIETGYAKLDLCYTDAKGNELDKDQVAAYVTETISWAPQGSRVYTWAPCFEWDRDPAGIDALHSKVKDHGWNVDIASQFKDTTGQDNDVGTCTLENLKSVREGGIVATHSHGNPEFFVAVYVGDERDNPADMAAADAWWNKGTPDQEEHMFTGWSVKRDMWYVGARPEWFENNWSARLNNSRSIVVMMGCYTSAGGPDSVVGGAGGRVGFGYPGKSNFRNHKHNMAKLFGRLVGRKAGGDRRTVGQAYDSGNGYVRDFEMVATDEDVAKWTTLNPAPNHTIVTTAMGKGAGNIVFDTYMHNRVDPSDAVFPTAGSTSARRWFGNGSGKYGVSFDTDGFGISMRAEADLCRNKSSYGARKMSGDRQNYGKDKDWSN